jgi:tRNA threonylcarbamoyl adenosine modification protein (Sua5/YciO/YrdC/YwlC family)
MLINIHPENPEPRKINQVIEILKNDGVIIYPTDTIYGLGCDIHSHKAMERICAIKKINPEKANLTFVCADLSNITDYSRPFSTTVYKIMKRCLPGPYTFILNANNNLPKLLRNKKKTVGIRVPNSPIVFSLVNGLGAPLLSTSIKNLDEEDDIIEYPTDPYEIHDQYENLVDLVIDGGFGRNIPSTIIDCTGDEIILQRAGLGAWDLVD